MRKYRWLVLSFSLISACEFSEGSLDGSFWDDARVDDEDAGFDEGDARPAGDSGTRDAGTDAGTDAATPPADLTPADVPAVLARGLCGALEACMGKTLLLESLSGNDCVTFRTRQQADRHLHWLAKSVSANRVTFRPERLAACERDLVALACDVRSRRLPASCEEAVEGNAEVDDNCTIDQDCADNAWCDKGGQESCPGQCVALQSQGLPCDGSMQCADGLICSDGNCAAPLSEGDPCDTTLDLDIDCPPGLVCHGRQGEQMCQSIESVYVGARDDACDGFGRLCQVGLVCQSQSQSSASTMGKCVPPAALNGSCRRSQPAQCARTQYCKDARTNIVDRARPGLDGVCSDRPTDGEACIPDEDCMPGTACVGSPATCRTLKRAGGECIGNAECYGGLCEESVCLITTIECP